jgi:flagellar biosynthesis chaperone FliJ
MTRRVVRVRRIADLARRQEEQARHRLASTRGLEQRAIDEVRRVSDELRGHHPTEPRLDAAIHELGRAALVAADQRRDDARSSVEQVEAVWRATHQRLGTLERLEERLELDEAEAARREEAHELDDLIGTRAHEARR